MDDLRLLVPSRGRPANVRRLVDACAQTFTARTRIVFGFDDDDPCLDANVAAAAGHLYSIMPRMTLTQWTNHLARRNRACPVLGSVGDDMVPVTPGGDRKLLESLPPGGGLVYPNDRRRDDIPEASIVSTPLVRAMGGYCPVGRDRQPVVSHWYWDNMLRDVFAGAGCLVYRGDIVVEHRHPTMPGGDQGDQTYDDAARAFLSGEDLAAYQKWRMRASGGLRDAIAAVRRVREQMLRPVRYR